MKLARTKQTVLVLATVLSLFVSAVAACACSHHETVKKAVDATSCHGASHDLPSASEAEVSGDTFESSCNCFVRNPTPAIVAKSGKKQAEIGKQIDETVLPSVGPLLFAAPVALVSVDVEPPGSNYKIQLLISLPSRAPPRLNS